MKIHLCGLEQLRDIHKVSEGKVVGLDVETTGLNPRAAKVVCIQMAYDTGDTFILDCRPFYGSTNRGEWARLIREWVYLPKVCVGTNLKFDIQFLQHHFGAFPRAMHDIQLQELIIAGKGFASVGKRWLDLGSIATRYGMNASKDLQKWSVDLDTRPEWWNLFPEDFIRYGAQDVIIPLRIDSMQQNKIDALGLRATCELENACIFAVADMEMNGCRIDTKRWREIIALKQAKKESIQPALEAELNDAFQRVSASIFQEHLTEYERYHKELQEYIDQKMLGFAKLPLSEKSHTKRVCDDGLHRSEKEMRKYLKEDYTKANKPPQRPRHAASQINLKSCVHLRTAYRGLGLELESMAKHTLEERCQEHPTLSALVQLRKIDTFLERCGEGFLARIEADGRIHPTYRQIGASTGRMSCSDPNWQQLPNVVEDESDVRRCVRAGDGSKLLTADLPAIEMRICAEISQCPKLNALLREQDIHSKTARDMFSLADEANPAKALHPCGKTFRTVAKCINFGLLYGQSEYGLARTLKTSPEKAREAIDRYFATYTGVGAWINGIKRDLPSKRVACTLGGRKRFLPYSEEPKRGAQEAWGDWRDRCRDIQKQNSALMRQALNSPIQGSNADILKYALIILHKYNKGRFKVIACIHDEIVVEAAEDNVPVVKKLLSRALWLACRHYLPTVDLPPIKVSVADFWSK